MFLQHCGEEKNGGILQILSPCLCHFKAAIIQKSPTVIETFNIRYLCFSNHLPSAWDKEESMFHIQNGWIVLQYLKTSSDNSILLSGVIFHKMNKIDDTLQ